MNNAMSDFPMYFLCGMGEQYVNVLSQEKAVAIDLYYNEVTGEVKYGYKTLDKRIVKQLLEKPGIYKAATAGDWNFAKGRFLNWVMEALGG
jgi:hypothetical protein